MEFEEIYKLISQITIVPKHKCKVLFDYATIASSLEGDFFECGVYKGGTSMMLSNIINPKNTLHLFDTFEGMPEVNTKFDNYHKKGDFSNTSLESVSKNVNSITKCPVLFYKGFIPDTFKQIPENQKISFAHIDVDIYQSIKDCCEFIYPRMVEYGVIVFDDYMTPSCEGAKIATDNFFKDKPGKLIALSTQQAIYINPPR
ncbi:MAG: TylF/MycF family methyltransferase [Magnetococcus sp. YQC-3]